MGSSFELWSGTKREGVCAASNSTNTLNTFDLRDKRDEKQSSDDQCHLFSIVDIVNYLQRTAKERGPPIWRKGKQGFHSNLGGVRWFLAMVRRHIRNGDGLVIWYGAIIAVVIVFSAVRQWRYWCRLGRYDSRRVLIKQRELHVCS